MKPLVSICIPTYNGAQFIAEAMQSVIAQTYPNLEIIVSDDASIDNTLVIIQQLKQKTSIPINIYHHKPNGIGANWNNCIKNANGKYIKFLFQDDILNPICIEDMVQVLEANKSIALVASKRELIVETSYLNEETEKWIKGYGNLQEALQLPLKNGMRILDRQLFKSDLFLCSPLNKVGEPSVTLFRKDLLKKTGYFREDLKQILDYEFYYRILKKYEIAILEKELVKFRLHQQQATNLNKGNDSSDYIAYDRIIYKEYFKFLNKEKQIDYLKKYNPFVKKYYLAVKLLLKIKRRLHL
ncbi:Putative glycosyltransferase EpsE [Mariniflexile rhizosphaerae]|uniref:glycosyltransferase family 2 protein n=1 Tax=unclassified Mariniflexile TaxID=2643887 RepID=UPI000CC488FA|nr:glycosyltransferase [Mariniflexile sp. TRM1-10]AXP79278.1 Putative glycosyltransferase EpsE [Mariniflexile sp. TRM1-10]PLB17769.1 MAG: Glycosyl transferase family 2 [Flavobacteriaceae bacterium FS1-H7996/R]